MRLRPTLVTQSGNFGLHRLAVSNLWAAGGAVPREPGPVKGGTTVIAFVQDPDGYKIELIERA